MSLDPLVRFHEWLDNAKERELPEPTAMSLATVDAKGRPAVRMVLLKEATSHGFVFYTNTQSPKGEQLHHSPWAELCFYWNPPGRQVRVHGRVESVSEAEADHYFASRPYRSQVGAWASQQSRPLASQAKLMAEAATTALKYAQRVPRPPHWSGFRVVPDWIEFWEERAYRLHDRVRYSRSDDGTWADQRLYP